VLFNSLHFLAFFPVVLAVYFTLPHRFRWAWLLAASCYFYAAFIPAYLLILFVLIGIDYVAGIAIEGAQGSRRKVFLVVSLVANCGMLGFFKYYNFLAQNLTALAHAGGLAVDVKTLAIVLPIGLSFHTFQSMSYTIEVYRGKQKAERHLGIYALYVLFWPQLVAGPIERPQNLLHQFREPKRFDSKRTTEGVELMVLGFAKKVLVADTLAKTVNTVYGAPQQHSGLSLLLATYFFAFQIYCDFAGYSDIARGAAKIMGFDLMVNFDRPYASATISEFWRRWHISLSTWFRDYLYIPLGGSRVSRARGALNLMIVFLVSGLWHGANWTFVIWGGVHGTALAASQLVFGHARKQPPTGLARVFKVLLTFHIVVLSWIFFRAETVGKAFYVLTHLVSANGAASWSALPETPARLALAMASILALEAMDLWWKRRQTAPQPAAQPALLASGLRHALALGIMILVLFRLTDDRGPQQFIYFQF
jgi:D-alanyl-lipoteichoic acid acyltransferase DltB (MBOAT superfamily)